MRMIDRTLTTEEVAALEQKPVKWVREACNQGLFPGAYRIGRQWRIPAESVEKFRENAAKQDARGTMRLPKNRQRRRDRKTR